MVEAYIICTCPSIWIADLNLNMMKGQSATFPEARARASKDLDVARRSGAVTVSYVELCKEVRPPVAEHAPHPPVKEPKVAAPVVERMVLDEEVLAQKLIDKMGSLRDASTNARIDALTKQVEMLQSLLVNQVHGSREISVPRGKVEDDKPVFIPEKIISGATGDTDLKVKETISHGNVDDASEVLRKLKRGKSR